MPEPAPRQVVTFQVLGPIAVRRDGRALPLTRIQDKRLLGLLLINRNRVLADDQIIDELWPTDQPRRPRGALHTAVSRLRKTLGGVAGIISRQAGGYVLATDPEAVDADCFEALLRPAIEDDARDRLHDALRLWVSDEPYADLRYEGFVIAESRRLQAMRIHAMEALFAIRLDHGESGALIPDLELLISEHPRRERAYALLMLAQYREGRVADALATFQAARHGFADVGLEVSQSLSDLELQVLTQDPRLDMDERTCPNNLPSRFTSLVGRAVDIKALVALHKLHRMVTVVGTAGVGKTSIAIEAARSVAARGLIECWLVDLSTVRRPDDLIAHVMTDVSAALGLVAPPLPHESTLVESIGARRLLLILDNCEQVALAVAKLVSSLLEGCPNLSVIATSQHRLGLPGEAVATLDPLPLGVSDESYVDERDARERNPAMRLFVDRALAAVPGSAFHTEDLEVVLRLCRRLDGIPLAIELAAAQTRSLTLRDIERQLDDTFRLLQSPTGPSGRHSTFEAALSWSYDALDPEAQTHLQLLACIDGPFAIEEAARLLRTDDVGASVIVARLCDRSLVRSEAVAGAARFTMLTVLQSFARGRARDEGVYDDYLRRHAECFHDLALRAGLHVTGGVARMEWHRRIRDSIPDFIKAIAMLIEYDRPQLAVEIAGIAGAVCDIYGIRTRGYPMIRDALAAAGPAVYDSTPHAHLVASLMSPPSPSSPFTGGEWHAREAIRTARLVGDFDTLAQATALRGIYLWLGGHLEDAMAALREADQLLIPDASEWSVTAVEIMGGVLSQALDHPEDAVGRLNDAISRARSQGDIVAIAHAQLYNGSALRDLGKYAESVAAYREASNIAHRHAFSTILVAATVGLALALWLNGDVDEATERTGQLLALLVVVPERELHAVGQVFLASDAPTTLQLRTDIEKIGERPPEHRPQETVAWLLKMFELMPRSRAHSAAVAEARSALSHWSE